MKESVLRFTCDDVPLVGILTEPEGAPASVGLLIVVGGPQYRAGSHRQFTLLARLAAASGRAALRFDYRGMGDSGGSGRNFEDIEADIAAAITAMMAARPLLQGVILHGLCDAASAALMYCHATQDTRVLGLSLQNPWFRSEQGQAQAVVTHYYGQRLRSPDFWLKLIKGGVGPAAVKEWLRNRRKARARPAAQVGDFKARMLAAWRQLDRPILLQLAGADLTAREFVLGFDAALASWKSKPRLALHQHAEADHTFSNAEEARAAHEEFLDWCAKEFKP